MFCHRAKIIVTKKKKEKTTTKKQKTKKERKKERRGKREREKKRELSQQTQETVYRNEHVQIWSISSVSVFAACNFCQLTVCVH